MILRQFFYAPNQLTFLRLVFVPPVIMLMLYGHFRWALLLVLIAGLSDGLDGVLARKLKQQTKLGSYLDPIADKLLLSASFVTLGVVQRIPLYVVILVLSRDVIIMMTVVIMLLTTSIRSFNPSIYGKLNTFAQVATVLITLFSLSYPSMSIPWLNQLSILATAALTVISGLHYARRTARLVSHLDQAEQ